MRSGGPPGCVIGSPNDSGGTRRHVINKVVPAIIIVVIITFGAVSTFVFTVRFTFVFLFTFIFV